MRSGLKTSAEQNNTVGVRICQISKASQASTVVIMYVINNSSVGKIEELIKLIGGGLNVSTVTIKSS